jgi:hypothetical protein
MGQSWNDYERAAERGPVSLGLKIIGGMLVLGVVLALIGHVAGWWGDAMEVARDEVGPKALVKKYEWFKDASAQLDRKKADIEVFEGRQKRMDDDYKGKTRVEWAREDREQYNLWGNETAGLKASYNGLAADYNSAMSKINWSFANAGSLPQGATVPLPREYKPYLTQ